MAPLVGYLQAMQHQWTTLLTSKDSAMPCEDDLTPPYSSIAEKFMHKMKISLDD